MNHSTVQWLAVVVDTLALVDVSITLEELGQRTLREVLDAQRWAVEQHATNDRIRMPPWLLEREGGA